MRQALAVGGGRERPVHPASAGSPGSSMPANFCLFPSPSPLLQGLHAGRLQADGCGVVAFGSFVASARAVGSRAPEDKVLLQELKSAIVPRHDIMPRHAAMEKV